MEYRTVSRISICFFWRNPVFTYPLPDQTDTVLKIVLKKKEQTKTHGKNTAILIGAGLRGGHVYASYALEHPDEFQIVAVAEPDIARRKQIAALHKIPEENQYESYEKLLQKECMADCALVCTQDQMHYEPVTMALQRGYHVLCEKPMST